MRSARYSREPAQMGNLELKRMSAQEFIRWEAEQEERYELVDGEVFAMTGGTYAHDRVRMNLSAALLFHLRGTPCRVIGPEVKIRVEPDAPAYYPDLFVACREIEPSASEVGEAKLIVAVLSPSTERKDRGSKWIEYQRLPMLQEYVVIDPDKRRIEIFRRMSAVDWRLHICGQAEPVRFESLEFATTFEVVFEDLG
jgi:Uma2 family endonuclease